MPTALHGKWSPPFSPQRTKQVLAEWRARPFGRLVGHFLARLISGNAGDAAAAGSEIGVGGLLGLLAVPGAFTSFLMLDKYSTFLNWYRGRMLQDLLVTSLPDKYVFIALSMAITGIVTVLKWDRILPDSQDYLNLAPLPLPPRRVLLANVTAIAIAAVVVAVDINMVSAVTFPFWVISALQNTSLLDYLKFVGTHAFCVMLASLFTFCAVFGLLGTVAAVLPRRTFRACSALLRGAVMVAMLVLLVSGFSSSSLLLHTVPDFPGKPSLWYLGLYQTWQHRASPAMMAGARLAVPGLGVAILLAVMAYGLSYRRRYAEVLDVERSPARQRLVNFLLQMLDLFSARSRGFTRACHRFVVRALLRSEGPRVCLAVAIGLGWLQIYDDGPWFTPFAAAYLLVLGLRIAFDLPAGVPAGWAFRAALDPRCNETLPAARLVMFSFLTPLVFLPALVLGWWNSGLPLALLHTVYLVAITGGLVEVLLAGYRKIPLTCPIPGFRDNLLMLCLVQLIGFEAFTRAGGAIETWMLAQPWRFLLVPPAMFGAWHWNRRRIAVARENGEFEEGLTFENVRIPVVERLDI